MASACELSSRSDGRDLPAWADSLKLLPLLNAEAPGADWRIVEAFSRSGLPFELSLAWSSGGGAGARAHITVARAARVCVFARNLRIEAGNLADAINDVVTALMTTGNFGTALTVDRRPNGRFSAWNR